MNISLVVLSAVSISFFVLAAHAGCYSSLDPSFARVGSGIAVDRNNRELYIAGGVQNFVTTARVDVLDLDSNTWTSFQLPAPRKFIDTFTYGPNVYFAGGSSPNYQGIDIYNTENSTITTIQLEYRPDAVLKSCIAGSMAYFYTPRSSQKIIAVDLTSNTITKLLSVFIDLTSVTTNGTHLFLLSQHGQVSSLYFVPVDTWQITLVDSVRLPPYEDMFVVGDRLVLIAPNQIGQVYLPLPTYSPLPPLVMNYQGAFQLGSDVYVLAPDQITVFSQKYGISQYMIGQAYFSQLLSAVEFEGRIYFSARDSINSVLTINTNALFNPLELKSDRASFVINGFYFSLDSLTRTIDYVKLSNRQLLQHNLAALSQESARARAIAADRLVIVHGREQLYDMFDTTTEVWTSGQIQFQFYPEFASTAINDVAVFKTKSNCYLFNTTSLEWTMFDAPGAVTAVGNSLAFIETNYDSTNPEIVQFYDLLAQRWSFEVTLPIPRRREVSMAAHGDLLIISGGVRNSIEFFDDVLILNGKDGSLKHERLSLPRSQVNTIGVGEFIVFAGGFQRAQVSTIDVFNIATSQWRTFSTAQNVLGRLALVPYKNTVFITRANGVELLNLTSGTIQLMPIPFTMPLRDPNTVPGAVVGSKVVLFGQTPSSLTVTMYETSTQISSTFVIGGTYILGLLTHNYIVAIASNFPRVLQFATMKNTLNDVQLFYGESTTFEVTTRGLELKSQWHHDNAQIPGETHTKLMLYNVTQQAEGDYSIKIIDQCSQLMMQQASLIVNGPPVIVEELTESIVMCREMANITTRVLGKQVTLNWTIGALTETTKSHYIIVHGSSFACNTAHRLCVAAINPSGTTTQCTQVRIVDHDSVFSGPRPISSQPPFIRKTNVDLAISLLDEECDSHVWLVNGVESNVTGGRASTMRVHIDSETIAMSFSVRARCGNSNLTSHAFKFDNVSSLDVGGVIVVVLVCFFGVTGALLIGFFVRRRILSSRKNEVELEGLLNQAKAETLNRDGVPILKSTTWEWSPNEQFTFKPIDKMPLVVDSSSLSSLLKHEPIKVGVWNQNILSFSLRGNNNSTKNKKSILKERLISGTRVDIYAPKSPKYEIKIEPSSFDLDSDVPVHVTVSSMMRVTAKCKVGLIIVSEHEQVYSICEFKLTSAMSTWIDLDEIEMTGDYLGGGGFGTVTRGIYRGQEIAVKKLLSQYLTPEMQIEFEREIMLMKDLHHPNIVQFIGASNIKNSLAIVIEFAPLGSLASVLEKHLLNLNMKITMLLESAKALQFLHANGIIHRDIKPQNILVFSLEPKSPVHVKLTDFGTARLISEEAMTVTKNIGTISFMAPESLGKNPRIEKSADVYSFALLMWAVLCEQTPFSDFAWDSDIEAHVKKGNRLPFPAEHRIDPALVSLIVECWEHEPNKRPTMANIVQKLTTLSSSK